MLMQSQAKPQQPPRGVNKMELLTSFFSEKFSGVSSLITMAITAGIFLYVFRNDFKKFLSLVFGYQNTFDDYAYSIHQNRDVIYDNKKHLLKTSMGFKHTLVLFASMFGLFLSPVAFLATYLFYVANMLRDKLKGIKDFKLYHDEISENDTFLKLLNNKATTIKVIVKQLILASQLLIAGAIFLKSSLIAFVGVFISVMVFGTSMLFLYNALTYKTNYKPIHFYRAMRLLQSTGLATVLSDTGIFISLSVYASATYPSISTLLWCITALRVAVALAINSTLSRDNSLSQYHEKIENRDYTNIQNIASYPNPKSQSRGYRFTPALQMKIHQVTQEITAKEKNEKLVFLDNYAFFPEMVNRSELRKNPLLKSILQAGIKSFFKAIDLTKQLIILGGMGSGKTEMINSVIHQVHQDGFSAFKAIIFNDFKGEYIANFYREGKDYILNLFDARSSVWCVFTEMKDNPEVGSLFISNLFESIAGEEKDFFNARAKQLVTKWLKEAFYETEGNIAQWELFFAKIHEYKAQVEAKEDKTKSSIWQTIEITLEIFEIIKYQICIEKRQTLSIAEFLRSSGSQLFLVNNPQYAEKLTPYITGLWAVIIGCYMAKENTKEHLILNILDEFLTLKMDKQTRKTLLTATRSKGANNVIGAQFLPKDEELMQEVDSSRYAIITFNINDDFTLEKIGKKFGEAEYLSTSLSIQTQTENRGYIPTVKTTANPSYALAQTKIMLEQQLQSMPPFHHLTFIPSQTIKVLDTKEQLRFFKLLVYGYDHLMASLAKSSDFLAQEVGMLYLGYTPMVKLEQSNASLVGWDMKEYYLAGNPKEPKKEAKAFEEKELFTHYLNVKFSDTQEAIQEYIKANELDKYDIEKIFADVEENSDKVLKLIARYSEQERYDLMEAFFDIHETDFDAKYEFCKKHDLIGGILGIFTFSEQFTNDVMRPKE